MYLSWRELAFAMSAVAIFCMGVGIFAGRGDVGDEKAMPVEEFIGKIGRLEIARSASDHLKNFISAAGGGLVTVFTVVLKFLIFHLSVAPFGLGVLFVGVLAAANYISSFVLMHLVGFRLATKQSPFFGAAMGRARVELESLKEWRSGLARRWRSGQLSHHSMNEYWKLGGLIHGIADRKWKSDLGDVAFTQALSALGNFSVVVAVGLLFGWVYRFVSGSAFLDPHVAKAALESLHPWRTGTLLYAGVTGALLWLSTYWGGVIAKWLKETSKFKVGIWTSICLGAALGFVPMIGKLLHLGLDVRHFTLSGGMVALAVSSLGLEAAWRAGLTSALIGVLAIGLLNFGVSFAIGFSVSRAKGGVAPVLPLSA